MGILCGGRGRRLGGRKHELVNEQGQSLLQYQVERHLPHFDEVLLLTGPEVLNGLRFSRKVTQQADPEEFSGLGPLAGILAGLKASPTSWLAVLAIDCPFFDPTNFQWAMSAADEERILGFIDHTGRQQWTPGLYHRELIPAAQTSLTAGNLSLGGFVKGHRHRFLGPTASMSLSEVEFTNINTPEQAEAAGFRRPSA